MDTIRRRIVRMAPENRAWGDTRLRGGGGGGAATSVIRSRGAPLATVRKERGLDPAPDRKTRTTWRELLAAHGDGLAAADCFTAEVWTPRGLTRFTRAGTDAPGQPPRSDRGHQHRARDGPWVTQLMRNATDAENGCLQHLRVLLHDRDPLFPAGREFVAHDHHEQNHQGLGGMLHYSYQSAA